MNATMTISAGPFRPRYTIESSAEIALDLVRYAMSEGEASLTAWVDDELVTIVALRPGMSAHPDDVQRDIDAFLATAPATLPTNATEPKLRYRCAECDVEFDLADAYVSSCDRCPVCSSAELDSIRADLLPGLKQYPRDYQEEVALPTNAGTDELIANLPNAAAVWIKGRAAMVVTHDDSTRRLYVEWGANGDAPTTREWVSYDVVQTVPLVRNGITRCAECGSQYHVAAEGGHVCDDGYEGMTFNAAGEGATCTLTTRDDAQPVSMAREMSSQAQAAKAIRAELKTAYSTVTFSVRSESFAGGNAVDVEWTDGPTRDQVEAIVGKYEYGHFDGMIDLYEYSNVRHDIPQAKYVQTRRTISPAARAAAIDAVNARFGWELRDHPNGGIDGLTDRMENGWRRSDEIHRLVDELSLLCSHCQAATLPGDAFCPMCGRGILDDPDIAVVTLEEIAVNAAQADACHTLTTTDPATPANAGGGNDTQPHPFLIVVSQSGAPLYCEAYDSRDEADSRLAEFGPDRDPSWNPLPADLTAVLFGGILDGEERPFYSADMLPEDEEIAFAPGIVGWDLRYTDPGNCISTPADWEPYPVLVPCENCEIGEGGFEEDGNGKWWPVGRCEACGGSGYVWDTEG